MSALSLLFPLWCCAFPRLRNTSLFLLKHFPLSGMFPGAHLAGNRNLASVSFSFLDGCFPPIHPYLIAFLNFSQGKLEKPSNAGAVADCWLRVWEGAAEVITRTPQVNSIQAAFGLYGPGALVEVSIIWALQHITAAPSMTLHTHAKPVFYIWRVKNMNACLIIC